MCGLAEILLSRGYQVSGSDLAESKITQRLVQLGANIVIGHVYSPINQVDLMIYSSAIPQDNPELMTARQLGIPIWRRGELLAHLMVAMQGIAIAGTHGKT